MRTIRTSVIIALLSAVGTPAFLAQDEGTDRGGPKSPEKADRERKRPRHGGENGKSGKGGLMQLSGEEWKRIREAMAKVWGEPEVASARANLQQASEAYRKALHQALEKQDPEMRKILKRVMEHGPRGGGPGDSPGRFHPPGGGRFDGMLRGLNAEERKIFHEASERARTSPAVVAAAEKRRTAKGMQEVIAAAREYRNVLHRAMVEADPRVGRILAKKGPGRERRAPGSDRKPPAPPRPEVETD